MDRVAFLKKCCIPAPVVGGLIFALLHLASYQMGIVSFTFDETLSKVFMTLFFTSIGFTASFKLLKKGSKKVCLFLIVSTTLVVLQNVLGAVLAGYFDLDPRLGLAMGSIPMVGGHATAGSWGLELESLGMSAATTVGIAAATYGLIAGSLMGGPLARSKIKKYNLKSNISVDAMYNIEKDDSSSEKGLNNTSFTNAAVLLIIAAGVGTYISDFFTSLGLTFPTYIGALLVGVVIRNFCDATHKELPATALDTWGNVSLTIFLSVALMTLKLWELAALATPMIVILVSQTILIYLFASFVVFRFMGRDYDAAVMTAAFCGFGMGATPNAMANMQVITKKYGPAPQAFFVVPLVGGLFIDIINTGILTFFLNIL